MMLASIPAPLELPFKTEFARLVPKAAPQVNTLMPAHHRARPASILVPNALLLPLTAQPAQLGSPSVKIFAFLPAQHVAAAPIRMSTSSVSPAHPSALLASVLLPAVLARVDTTSTATIAS
jgi:hypothetical protein